MTAPATTPMTFLAAWRRFRVHLQGEGRRLAVAAVLLIAAAAGQIVAVFVLADVIDGTLAAHGIAAFATVAATWIGITALSTGADYLGQVTAVGVSERVVLRLRDNLFRHLQTLAPLTHRRFGVGDLITRSTGDLEAVEHLIGSGLMQLTVAALSTIGLVAAALVMSWPMAVVALCAVPILWGVSAFFGRRQSRATRDERAAISDISVAVGSAITGHETAAAYNQQPRERDRLHRHGVRWLVARLMQTRIEVGFGSVLGLAEVVVTLAIAVTGVWQVRQGALSVGELLALTGYLGMLYPRMQEIADLRLSVASALVSAERLAEILDSPTSDTDTEDAVDLLPGPGRIHVQEVTFRRGQTTILDRVSLDLRPGRVTALTGPSGSGKSTLAALLTGFEHPDAGAIHIDGTDLESVTRTSLRDQVTLLPQSPTIAAMTIAEAISYGRPEATRAQVEDAARAADAHEFVAALPEGYDTPLSDDGLTLSGGQRQRLAIARALLRDSPIVVLDEPTANLDDASAARLMSAIRVRCADRTVLVITHDRTVAAGADDVYDLVDGRVHRVAPAPHRNSSPVADTTIPHHRFAGRSLSAVGPN
ncbi:ABC transporter ATP-binding protein [Gordonia soli]|uniref:Putative ABC transporter permease/ATP-binding protein n=1 Tax=Gordonia soli NBRC 108243 TaxID=1223545 RepID=M0QKI9_9ACTN|nr:ABC transporter ATP-binding protein [Gordonia soli]GAC69078.1 putative ABC transporter permease/ATP-binding protein [Gordonia soli NBRC 108243]